MTRLNYPLCYATIDCWSAWMYRVKSLALVAEHPYCLDHCDDMLAVGDLITIVAPDGVAEVYVTATRPHVTIAPVVTAFPGRAVS